MAGMKAHQRRAWSWVVRAVMWIALSSLLLGVALIAVILTYAYLEGDWPFEYLDRWDLNHGPWRYTFGVFEKPKAKWLSRSFVLLIVSLQSSTLLALLRRDRLSVILLGCSFVTFWLAANFLYWLID